MALRGQLAAAFAGRFGLAFGAEILIGGVLPLVLLARASSRNRREVLFAGALLAVLGVVYNRINVVLFAMTFRGRMPWVAQQAYAPSVFEREGGSLPSSRVDLRRAARLFACSSIGTMDAFCMRYGQPKPPLTRGRAGRRLSSLVTISRILNPES